MLRGNLEASFKDATGRSSILASELKNTEGISTFARDEQDKSENYFNEFMNTGDDDDL